MMCGLLKPDEGQVYVNGKPIQNGDQETRLRVGVCPQHILLWGMSTCIEQLIMIGERYGVPRHVARQRGLALLEVMDLLDKRDRVARSLPGGIQRRLNLIMALVHDPDILVLDEPETGLDPQSRGLVRDMLRSLARQKTILLATQNMEETAQIADRVAIIDQGRLLALGTADELKRRLGAGDVLEIELECAGEPAEIQPALAIAETFLPKSILVGTHLIAYSPEALDRLPGLLEALRGAGFSIGGVQVRGSALEDVFLRLTGRILHDSR